MEKLSTEQQTAIHRQRRFLILMSLAVIAYYLLGIKVKSEAQYSGFVLTLAKPDRAVYGLWLVWGWALWRYIQHANELLLILTSEIYANVESEEKRIIRARLRKHGNRLAAQGKLDDDLPKSAHIRGHVFLGSEESTEAGNIGARNERRDYDRTLIGDRNYSGHAEFIWADINSRGSTSRTFWMKITRRQVSYLRFYAWINAAMRLHAINEHIAPLLIAVSTVVISGLSCVLS